MLKMLTSLRPKTIFGQKEEWCKPLKLTKKINQVGFCSNFSPLPPQISKIFNQVRHGSKFQGKPGPTNYQG